MEFQRPARKWPQGGVERGEAMEEVGTSTLGAVDGDGGARRA